MLCLPRSQEFLAETCHIIRKESWWTQKTKNYVQDHICRTKSEIHVQQKLNDINHELSQCHNFVFMLLNDMLGNPFRLKFLYCLPDIDC